MMMLLTMAALGLAALWLYFRVHSHTSMDTIPGPARWPLIGNLLQLTSGNIHLLLTEWVKTYGSVFQLCIGSERILVVNDIEALNEVLVSKSKEFGGRKPGFRANFINNYSLGVLNMDPCEQWMTTRKLIHGSLKAFGSGMGRIEHLTLEMTDQLMSWFDESNKAPIDPYHHILSASLKMISIMVWGENYDKKSIGYKCAETRSNLTLDIFAVSKSGMLIDRFPWLRHFNPKIFQDMKILKKANIKFWKSFASEKLVSRDPNLDSMGAVPLAFKIYDYNRHTDKNIHFSDDFIQNVLYQLEIAGITTTARSFYALLNILLHHKNIQGKIQQEIHRVLGDRPLELNDKSEFPYTQAVLLELLRYTSISPFGIPHKTTKEVHLQSYTIPANTQVLCNLWAMHHDDTFWWQPFSFQPERFLDAQGELVSCDHPNRRRLLAFGAGIRVCVGQTLATARLFLWTVFLLQRFDLQAGNGETLVSCDPRTYKPEAVLKPLPFKVCFIPRK